MKKKQRIYSPQWLEFHPYENSSNSDIYYVKLSNKVLDVINDVMDNAKIDDLVFIDEERRTDLACVLTCYFEDIISQTNIWKSVSTIITNKTGKPVPFYNVHDYAEDEINVEDIKFICWHYFQNIHNNDFCISPLNKTIEKIAEPVYAIFDEEYEEAPENEKFKKFFEIKAGSTISDLESKLLWISTDTYLTGDNSKILDNDLEEISAMLKEQGQEEEVQPVCFDYIMQFAINNETEYFGVRAPQILAGCLDKEDPYFSILMNMGVANSGYFLYEGKEGNNIMLRHVATDRAVKLAENQVSKYPKDLMTDDIVLKMTVVNWGEDYVITGGIRSFHKDDAIIEEIKGLPAEVNFFNNNEPKDSSAEEKDQAGHIKAVVQLLGEDEPDLIVEDAWWEMLKDTYVSHEYIKNGIAKGEFPELKFPEDFGQQLFADNIDFILAYQRQPQTLLDYMASRD